MRILVLCADYPNLDGGISLNYVHTRNVSYYVNWGVDVTVINFKTKQSYIKDGIKVISLKDFENTDNKIFDILVCHASNIRNHYVFLKKYDRLFPKIVFFFHGHEVMKLTEDYPKEYSFKNGKNLKKIILPIYDNIKFKIWKRYIISQISRIHLIFVSEWMYDIFIKNLKIDGTILKNNMSIIYNSVSKNYETLKYDISAKKTYDYITIRSYIDTSKYAIDLVNKFAFANPDKKFLVVGKGEFFNHFEKADNIEHIEQYMDQNQIIGLLNKSKCALMPTRCDSQGVMACEMATFGIPLVTSDIDVCRLVLKDFPNVGFINNQSDGSDLQMITRGLMPCVEHTKKRFFESQTIGKEMNLFKYLMTLVSR